MQNRAVEQTAVDIPVLDVVDIHHSGKQSYVLKQLHNSVPQFHGVQNFRVCYGAGARKGCESQRSELENLGFTTVGIYDLSSVCTYRLHSSGRLACSRVRFTLSASCPKSPLPLLCGEKYCRGMKSPEDPPQLPVHSITLLLPNDGSSTHRCNRIIPHFSRYPPVRSYSSIP